MAGDASRTPGQGRNKSRPPRAWRAGAQRTLVRRRKAGTSSLGGNPIPGKHIGSSPFQTSEIPQGRLSGGHKFGLP